RSGGNTGRRRPRTSALRARRRREGPSPSMADAAELASRRGRPISPRRRPILDPRRCRDADPLHAGTRADRRLPLEGAASRLRSEPAPEASMTTPTPLDTRLIEATIGALEMFGTYL